MVSRARNADSAPYASHTARSNATSSIVLPSIWIATDGESRVFSVSVRSTVMTRRVGRSSSTLAVAALFPDRIGDAESVEGVPNSAKRAASTREVFPSAVRGDDEGRACPQLDLDVLVVTPVGEREFPNHEGSLA